MTALSDDAVRLLTSGATAHLSTLMPDGHPKVEPVWVDHEDGHVLVATDEASIKAKNTALDDRVALSIVALDDPYEQLLIRGRVIERRADGDLAVLDRLSFRYLGVEFPRRKWNNRVVLVVDPTLARYYLSGLSALARK